MGDDQPVVLLVTYMGSTSMFHDISPDANGAASNNLALLLSAHLISSALDDGAAGCDAAIWAATGFSDAPDRGVLDQLKAVFALATNAKATADAVGLPALGTGLAGSPRRALPDGGGTLPKVVMLSSAGVTRPDWSEEKKSALEGAAKIPIVRLNPFGILGVKRESEETLRACGEWTGVAA